MPELLCKPLDWPEPPDPIAYSALAGDVVRALENDTEGDPAALLVQFLVAFGNVVGRGTHWRVGGTCHYTNLFALVTGPTSTGRKGTGWDMVRPVLEAVDRDWSRGSVAGGIESAQGLIARLSDPPPPLPGDEEEIEDYRERFQAWWDHCHDDKRFLWLETEFGRLLGILIRPGTSTVIRQAWDSVTLESHTKRGTLQAANPHVSIVAHITTEELRRKMGSTDLVNGFCNRFLLVASRRMRELPFGGRHPLDLVGSLLPSLEDAVKFARGVGLVRRDVHADSLWAEVYSGLTQRPPGIRGAATSRAEAQTMRLALLYALLDQSELIREEHLKAALALWDYCERSAYYVWSDRFMNRDLDRLCRAIEESGERGLTLTSVVHELFRGNKPKEEVHALIEQAIEFGVAMKSVQRTDGRPVTLLLPIKHDITTKARTSVV